MKHQKNNIDEIDKILYNYFEKNKEVPIETTKTIKNTINSLKPKKIIWFKAVATICTIFFITTSVVFAKNIAKFFSEVFNLTSINLNNDSVIDAIENKEYIQNVSMDYINIDDNYKIKADYLMLDDINLYIVFNLYSNDEIKTNYRLSITNLEIIDSNNNYLYDINMKHTNADFLATPVWKNIETSSNTIRELFCIVSNGIPNISDLNIKFTKLTLYDANNQKENPIIINCNCDFSIDLIDKFIDREIINYNITTHKNNDYDIQKCIATDTGLYLLYKTEQPYIDFKFSTDNVTHKKIYLGTVDNKYYQYLIQFHISKDKLQRKNKLKIIAPNNEKLMFTKIN